jgi:hypothetical protein
MSAEDAQALCNYLYQALLEQLATKFTIVDTPGPGVIKVQTALTDAESAVPVLRTVSMLIPQARALATLKYLATSSYPFVGGAQGELEGTDSRTGQVLGAALDRQIGGGSLQTAAQWQWGDAKNSMDRWAALFISRLLVRPSCPEPPIFTAEPRCHRSTELWIARASQLVLPALMVAELMIAPPLPARSWGRMSRKRRLLVMVSALGRRLAQGSTAALRSDVVAQLLAVWGVAPIRVASMILRIVFFAYTGLTRGHHAPAYSHDQYDRRRGDCVLASALVCTLYVLSVSPPWVVQHPRSGGWGPVAIRPQARLFQLHHPDDRRIWRHHARMVACGPRCRRGHRRAVASASRRPARRIARLAAHLAAGASCSRRFSGRRSTVLIDLWNRRIAARIDRQFAAKSLDEIFEAVYQRHLGGGGD